MKNLLFWNGMASKQVSGGDVYVKKFVENIREGVDIVISGPAVKMMDMERPNVKLFIVDEKISNGLFSLVFLYTSRLIKASVLALQKRSQRYSSVISSSPFIYDLIPAALSKSNKKIVILFHILPNRENRDIATRIRFIMAKIEQRISLLIIGRYFDTILVGNENLKKYIVSKYPDKNVYVAHAGIDVSRIDIAKDYKKDPDLGVFVGRLTHQKGIIDLVYLAKKMQKIHPKFQLLIIGDGPDKQAMLDEIENNKVNNIRLMGFLPDAEKYSIMKKAKYFIFPSYEEGWGIALAEALYCECIAVCYELDHYRSIFGNYPSYVALGDKESLVDELHRVYGQTIRPGQRKHIKKFEDSASIKQVLIKCKIK